MANKDGIITRKDIIEDDALRFGEVYADNIKVAIKSNNELVESVKELNKQVKAFKGVTSQKEYITAKQEEALATQKAINAIKQQEAAELSANKIRLSAIKIIDAETKSKKASKSASSEQITLENQLISTKRKNELATESTNRKLIEERALLQQTNAEIKRQTIANGALANAYKELSAKTAIAGDKVKNIIATGKKAGETQAQYNKRLKEAQTYFDQLNTRVRAADAAVGQFNRNVGNYPKQAAAGLKNLISAFGVTSGIYLFAQVMKDAYKVTRDFEKQNATLSGILQVEKESMKDLTNQAKELGARTVKTAGEVTGLQIAYARLGFSQKEILDVTESTIEGSIALNAQLDKTAELTGAVIRTFDDFSSTDAPEIIDIMSLATAKSALNFEKLETGIPIVAGAANAAKIPFTTLVALLGKLSDAGIDTSSSATALRNIFIEAAAQGLDYGQILQKIKDSQDKLTTSNDEFGKRAAVSAAVLAQNIDKTAELDEALQGAAGTAESMANKELATLDGAVKLLSSAWDGLILDTTDANSANAKLASGITFLAENLKTIFNVLTYLTVAWVGYKAALLLANVQTKLIALNTAQATAAQTANTTAVGAGTVAQTANATATTTATTAWQRFNAVLKANALFLAVTVLITAIYYLNKLNKSLEEVTQETKSSTESFLKNREEVVKNSQSINTLADRYDVLKSKSKLTKEEQKELNDITKELGKTVPEATEKINEYGDALEVNTDKIREYTNSQKEYLALQKTVQLEKENKLLKQQKEYLADINKANIEASKIYDPKFQGFIIEGAGAQATSITTLNGKLKIRNSIYEQYRDLTNEELLDFQTKKINAEKEIQDTQKRISQINSIIDLTKKSKAETTTASSATQESTIRTIGLINDEIKAQEDLISGLSDKTGREGAAIKAKIEALEAEKELIYSTEKAEKSKFDNGLKGYKDVKDAIYQLSQFRYENEIELNEKIIDSDKETTQNKIDSLNYIAQLTASKNDETLRYELEKNALEKEDLDKLSKEKLQAYKKDVEARVDALVNGKIAVENISNEEKLILEKYYAKKQELQDDDKKRTQAIIDAEVDSIKKKVDAEIQLQENALNQDIVKENNVYADELKSAEGNFALIEKAREEHEKRIFKIQKKYALQALNSQIEALEQKLSDNDSLEQSEQISAEKRAQIVADLERFKREASDLETAVYIENIKNKEEKEREFNQKVKEMSLQLKDALIDFTNAIFDRRIQKIDDTIDYNEEYYARQIELAGNDQEQKDLLAEEAEKKRKKLEAEKRKEQRKQAILNKAMAALDIGLQTGIAIVKSVAASPLTGGLPFSAIAAGIGALQLAAVLASPIPKYKHGRKGGPEELAIVGDGGVSEVIERKTGAIEVSPAKDTLVKLNAGDKVHSSIEEYNRLQRAAFKTSLNIQGKKTTDYQASQIFNNYNEELVQEMIKTRRAIEKSNNTVIVNTERVDIPHHVWKNRNTMWN